MVQSAMFDAPEPDPQPRWGRSMTIEEWEAMDEDEPGELVDGRLEEEEVPDNPHEVIVSALLFLLMGWARSRGGTVLGSEAKFALNKRRGRKPDISVITSARRLPRRGANRVPPDIMVEVVSPAPRHRRRDRVEKVRDYAAFGVRWYWLVDPEARTIEIFGLGDDGRYTLAVSAAEGSVDVPGCEGLTLDLDALWRELDTWLEDEDEAAPR